MKKNQLFQLIIVLLILCLLPAWAEDSEQDFHFVFMTDIHLKPEKQAGEGFQKAIDKLNSLDPLFVIAGGDLIYDAFEQPYKRADQLYRLYLNQVKSIKAPVFAVMGNHDVFAISPKSKVHANHPEYGKKMFTTRINPRYYRFNKKGWEFIILDSIYIKEDSTYEGRIHKEQINWLKKQLQDVAPDTPIIIASHFPFLSTMPFIDKRFKPEKFILQNGIDVLELFKNHNLRLILQGHVHNHEVIKWQGITFISGGAVCANWWDGPLHNMEEGFTLITIKNNRIIPQYIDYHWQEQK